MPKKKLSDSQEVAYLISRIFDPIIVLPVLLLVAAWGAWLNGQRIEYLSLLLLLDVVLPGFVLMYFVKRGQIGSGWDITKRSERVPLFLFVVLVHLTTVVLVFLMNKHPLAEYLASFWILTVVYALITLKWKISVHSGVLSALVTFLVLTEGKVFTLLYVFVLIVIWARVVGKYHRLTQAIAGACVPVFLLPICFRVFGLL